MISAELDYSEHPVVTLIRDSSTSLGGWSRIQATMGRGIVSGDKNRADVKVDTFFSELDCLREVKRVFGDQIDFGPILKARLRLLIEERKARESVSASGPASIDGLEEELIAAGFCRQLKKFQLSNVAELLRLPHGADFSVPGAGKTTVGLANFSLCKYRGLVTKLLVVAPIAAFEAWKEEAAACFTTAPIVVIHAGVDTIIPENTEILLTNYNRLAADYDEIRSYVASSPTQVILDEAHRIKRGALGVHGRAVLDLSYAAKRRDILTGTPTPQGAYDLIALMSFLYPGQDKQILPPDAYEEKNAREEKVLLQTSDAIKPFFVRTTKSQLDLPRTEFIPETQAMGDIQNAIYSALIGKYRSVFQLEKSDRREFSRLGRIMMYLLEAATNPMLLRAGSDSSDPPEFIHPPIELEGDEPLRQLLDSYHLYETPWKYERVRQIVKSASLRGEKVLVWSSFVRNLKALSKFLQEFNPAMVHGGIPSANGAVPTGAITRENELARFRYDDSCHVLLANPAACGEGVSLHHWCHHAVYVDRSFNAGQFLQSQDRIHRLGLGREIITSFTILSSKGTIDETVGYRLADKVRALSHLMGDPGLVRLALPEEDNMDGDEMYPTASASAAEDDMLSVLGHLKNVA